MRCFEGNGQMIKMSLYSPLAAEFFPTGIYENDELMNYKGPLIFDGEDLVEYAPELFKTGLAGVDLGENFGNKRIIYAVPYLKIHKGELVCCTTVMLREALDEAEMQRFQNYLTDKFCAGELDLSEIETTDGVLFVHLWNSDEFAFEAAMERQIRPPKLDLGR